MTLLYRVIYAAHANGSHHKIALDALCKLTSRDAEGWRRLFLKHAELFLKGSKAPDKEFKDFKNHVLHVKDAYWGGAIEKTQTWYDHLISDLKAEKWTDAVYCAGVLSHYLVDPIHPFHTGQSDAESNVHRAVEWSIAKSYDSLNKLSEGATLESPPQVTNGTEWLAELVCAGAERSHQHYDTLLVHYDIHRGVVDPPAGLDDTARHAVAGLIRYAASSFALVLNKAFEEAGVTPPKVALTLDTVLATLSIPKKWVLNKLEDRADRAAVEAMYDELQTTGTVDKTLSEDDRVIRDLHALEIQSGAAGQRASVRAERIRSAAAVGGRDAATALASADDTVKPIAPPAAAGGAASETTAPASEPVHEETAVRAPEMTEESPHEETEDSSRAQRGPRLSVGEPVEAAPSIGPKTAARLEGIGIFTVQDLLNHEPAAIAGLIPARHIDAKTVGEWQDQARLASTLPDLSGTNAQLLVGSGYRTLEDLSEVDAADVYDDLADFVITSAGERILRGGKPPSAQAVAAWVAFAREQVRAAA